MSLRDNLRGNLNRQVKKVKKSRVIVDLNNRMKRSFGTPLAQVTEVHYQGRPLSFSYNGPIESLTIDIVHREQQKEEKEYGIKTEHTNKEDVTQVMNVEQFDPSARRSELADVYLSCSCGSKFRTKIPITQARLGNEVIKKNITDPDIREHMGFDRLIPEKIKKTKENKKGKKSKKTTEQPVPIPVVKEPEHKLSIDYVEVQTEKIPEQNRIKDFNQDKVNFYRIFPTKTAEVKYLASYDQDLLAESPQVKYSQTQQGSEYLRKQNMAIMFFLFGVFVVFEYLIVAATTSGIGVYNPNPVNYTPWYIVIVVIIAAVIGVWKVRLHEMSKTMVKLISLQSAPFHISNRGILPVVMTNSNLNPMWEYQSKVMHANDKNARDLYYSITTWSDNQIAELYTAKVLGQVEHELSIINNEISDIQKLDYEYRNAQTVKKATSQQILYAIFGTIGVYTLLMFALGFL